MKFMLEKTDYKSRRNSGSGGHVLYVGYPEIETNRVVNYEMNDIKKETDDVICVFTKNECKYRYYDVHMGKISEDGNFDFLLEEGRRLVEKDKRFWLFFDYYLDFNENTIKNFLDFARKARKCGIIITLAAKSLSSIPDDMFSHFIAIFSEVKINDDSISDDFVKSENSNHRYDNLADSSKTDGQDTMTKYKLERIERQLKKYKIIVSTMAIGLIGVAVLLWKNRKK